MFTFLNSFNFLETNRLSFLILLKIEFHYIVQISISKIREIDEYYRFPRLITALRHDKEISSKFYYSIEFCISISPLSIHNYYQPS